VGVDMSALNPRVTSPAGFVPRPDIFGGDDPWYFHLNWWGMGRMAEEMDRAGVIDAEAQHAPWPDRPKPDEEHFEDLDERDENGRDEKPLTPEALIYQQQIENILRHVGESGKVALFKFGSNDGWVVTQDECRWIADALDQRAALIDNTDWQRVVEAFAAFNRRCATEADGYAVW
jgi:hypothetical protein